jgi:hypothetical protein
MEGKVCVAEKAVKWGEKVCHESERGKREKKKEEY